MTLPLMIAVGAIAWFAWQQPATKVEMGQDPVRFAARLHPALTHLPIGMLVLVPILDVLGVFKRSRYLWASGHLVMWVATLFAIVAAASGYLLAKTEGHTGEAIVDHQWAGITLAGACCVALMFRSLARGGVRRKSWGLLYLLSMAFVLVTLTAAGHLGGKITHGDDFVTKFAPEPLRSWMIDEKIEDAARKAIETITDEPRATPATSPAVSLSDRTVFASIVQPIFAQKCVECHGPRKEKGDLRLDTYANAMKGGGSGDTIVPGDVPGSELVRLISLPSTDNDVMPPAKHTPLTPAEIDAIRWWIANGASDTLTLGQADNVPESVKALAR